MWWKRKEENASPLQETCQGVEDLDTPASDEETQGPPLSTLQHEKPAEQEGDQRDEAEKEESLLFRPLGHSRKFGKKYFLAFAAAAMVVSLALFALAIAEMLNNGLDQERENILSDFHGGVSPVATPSRPKTRPGDAWVSALSSGLSDSIGLGAKKAESTPQGDKTLLSNSGKISSTPEGAGVRATSAARKGATEKTTKDKGKTKGASRPKVKALASAKAATLTSKPASKKPAKKSMVETQNTTGVSRNRVRRGALQAPRPAPRAVSSSAILYSHAMEAYKKGNHEQTLVLLLDLLDKQPDRTGLRLQVGWLLVEMERANEAKRIWKKGLTQAPKGSALRSAIAFVGR